MSAAGKRHLGILHELQCVVHLFCYGKWERATEAHHLEFNRGEHSSHATIPVCGSCHDELHEMRRRAFYRAHKLTDVKLLAWTAQLLQSYYEELLTNRVLARPPARGHGESDETKSEVPGFPATAKA